MTTTPICFVDTETTGLIPDRHPIWEVGCIMRWGTDDPDEERRWLLPVTEEQLNQADPVAMGISGFPSRHPQGQAYTGKEKVTSLSDFAIAFRNLTSNAHLVGAIPSFDEERLRRDIFGSVGQMHGWHYHIIDVESMAVGYLVGQGYVDARRLPWDSKKLSEALGLRTEDYEVHTALGDARWARDMYDVITERRHLRAREVGR